MDAKVLMHTLHRRGTGASGSGDLAGVREHHDFDVLPGFQALHRIDDLLHHLAREAVPGLLVLGSNAVTTMPLHQKERQH